MEICIIFMGGSIHSYKKKSYEFKSISIKILQKNYLMKPDKQIKMFIWNSKWGQKCPVNQRSWF